MTLDNTNVKSIHTGRDILKDLALQDLRYVVTTMAIPWSICREQLTGDPLAVIHADSMERRVVEKQIEAVPDCDLVIAIGGGRAVDLGKYLAFKRGLRLITIPTVLSVDAFVTPAAGLRENGRVTYVGHSSPDPLVIDYNILRTAPPELNIAGIGDLLSIHTAVFDWQLAARDGRSEYPFSKQDCEAAVNILQQLEAKVDAIRRNQDEGLQAIVDGYLAMNKICIPASHYRVEEGSEHYLFYELEERTKRSFIHGPIIGLGIYLLSRLQANQPDWITNLMDQVGLDYHPKSLELDRKTLKASLLNLRSFVESRNDLWYTIIHTIYLTSEKVDVLLDGLEF